MCLAIPGQIKALLDDQNGLVNIGGIEKQVNLALIENPQVDEWVIVHVGFAIHRIDEAEAQATLKALSSCGELTEEALNEVAPSV